MTSPPRGHRWAPILNDVWQGRLENSLEPLRHISTHPDEPHPHMRKPVCTCLTPAPKQPTSTTTPTWTPQQRATLTQRDVHGGLFGVFGREWENTLRSKNKKEQIARKRVLPSRAAR